LRKLLDLGLVLVLVGFFFIAIGCAGGVASVGGVVFIGPVPVVFGSGPAGDRLALISIIIGAIMMMILLAWAWRLSSSRRAEGPKSPFGVRE
jgi:uncharacterized membrane protein